MKPPALSLQIIMELNKSKIHFFEDGHRYLNLDTDKELMSVTTLIRQYILPNDNYSGVSQATLERKANIGKHIHSDCQMCDDFDIEPLDTEYKAAVVDYVGFRKSLGMKSICSEYLVTDNERYAGSIDCVWTKDNEVFIADIKCTYNFDEEYVMWQTNIYAYLFGLLNPHIKVGGLYCVWLPVRKQEYVGRLAKLVPLKMLDRELIKSVLDDPEGYRDSHSTALTAQNDSVQLITHEALQMLIEAEETAKSAKQRADDIKAALMQAMKEHGIKSWDSGMVKATYTPEHVSSSFDSRAFKAAEPELYEKYTKEKKVNESIRITIRK